MNQDVENQLGGAAGNQLVTADKKDVAIVQESMRNYGHSSCMEVSKQTFTEIEEITKASQGYYKNHVILQGVWPDRRIIFRSISLQASQQFDSVAFMQMKNEFRGVFADVATLREENRAKDQRIAELEADLLRAQMGMIT